MVNVLLLCSFAQCINSATVKRTLMGFVLSSDFMSVGSLEKGPITVNFVFRGNWQIYCYSFLVWPIKRVDFERKSQMRSTGRTTIRANQQSAIRRKRLSKTALGNKYLHLPSCDNSPFKGTTWRFF